MTETLRVAPPIASYSPWAAHHVVLYVALCVVAVALGIVVGNWIKRRR
jgi:hypothetical protein